MVKENLMPRQKKNPEIATLSELAEMLRVPAEDLVREVFAHRICGLRTKTGQFIFPLRFTVKVAPDGALILRELPEDVFLTARQVAELIGRTTRAVTRAARVGILPCIQTSPRGRMRFPLSLLRKALEEMVYRPDRRVPLSMRKKIELESMQVARQMLADLLDLLRDRKREILVEKYQTAKNLKGPMVAIGSTAAAQGGTEEPE
jgi:hypothetical protein